MAAELKAGPMTVEKQMVLYVRSRGAPQRGPADFVVAGSWVMIHAYASWLLAPGAWLMADGSWAMSHEP